MLPDGSYCAKLNLSAVVYETVHFYFNNTDASYVRNVVNHRETDDLPFIFVEDIALRYRNERQ